MAIQRAFLLIADIGGYTRFMKVHRVNLSHAQDVVARLLESVIDSARSPLKLSKLEGDAALFWAPLSPKKEESDVAAIGRQVEAIRKGFLDRQASMVATNLCTCQGCVETGTLKLKFVAHVGEVALQKVKGLTELAGVDVIVVHRMLKNEVPIPEYVLMTEQVLKGAADGLRSLAKPIEHEFEGIGRTSTWYVDLAAVAARAPAQAPASMARKWWELFKRNVRAAPYFMGLKKPCEGFHNLELAEPQT